MHKPFLVVGVVLSTFLVVILPFVVAKVRTSSVLCLPDVLHSHVLTDQDEETELIQK